MEWDGMGWDGMVRNDTKGGTGWKGKWDGKWNGT